MTITSIEPFSKGNGRYAIYLNDEFAFVLYKGELSKYKLEVNQEITDEQYCIIMNQTLIPRAKKRGMNLLKTMDRTEADVRNKLGESGYTKEAIDAAIDYLKSFKYIDDMRYASSYIHFKSSQKSKRQIRVDLINKGINQDIIDKAYIESEEDDESEELKLIEKLITKRVKGDIGSQTYMEKQKLFAYLYNKGFAITDIEKVYNNLT